LISLDPACRVEAASDFFGEEHVPRKAVVMGVLHLMTAKQIVGIAVSEGKAKIIKRLVEETSKTELVLSQLQHHNNVTLIVDTAAASELTRFKCPWLVKNSLIHIQYSPNLIRKAVIWLGTYFPLHSLPLINIYF
jgi:glucosamine-6-phosphate deaminase